MGRAGSLAAAVLVVASCGPAIQPTVHHPTGAPEAKAHLARDTGVAGDVVCLAVSWQHVCVEDGIMGPRPFACDKLPFDVVVRCTGAACERAVIDEYGFGGSGVVPIKLASPGELQLDVTLAERNGKRTATFHLPTVVATDDRPSGITDCNEPVLEPAAE